MPTLEIIGAPQSNYVWVVHMVCAEKGVLLRAQGRSGRISPGVDAIHPFGKIPVMRRGDIELCESKAIATYIDRVFDGPKVIPEDPKPAAKVEQWVSLGNVEFDRLMIRQYVVGYAFPKECGKPDMAAIGAAAEKMKPQVAVLDPRGRRDRPSGRRQLHACRHQHPADAVLCEPLRGGQSDARRRQNLSAYMERHFARPSFKASAPPPPPQSM